MSSRPLTSFSLTSGSALNGMCHRRSLSGPGRNSGGVGDTPGSRASPRARRSTRSGSKASMSSSLYSTRPPIFEAAPAPRQATASAPNVRGLMLTTVQRQFDLVEMLRAHASGLQPRRDHARENASARRVRIEEELGEEAGEVELTRIVDGEKGSAVSASAQTRNQAASLRFSVSSTFQAGCFLKISRIPGLRRQVQLRDHLGDADPIFPVEPRRYMYSMMRRCLSPLKVKVCPRARTILKSGLGSISWAGRCGADPPSTPPMMPASIASPGSRRACTRPDRAPGAGRASSRAETSAALLVSRIPGGRPIRLVRASQTRSDPSICPSRRANRTLPFRLPNQASPRSRS